LLTARALPVITGNKKMPDHITFHRDLPHGMQNVV